MQRYRGGLAPDGIVRICREANAHTIAKGKSMLGEELDLNARLEREGFRPIETDLGEYIACRARRTAGPIHRPGYSPVAGTGGRHLPQGATPSLPPIALAEPRVLLDEARTVLRRAFLTADVGIAGANMLIAETGSLVLVTNEGNGDLTCNLPKVHIAIASIEKVVPTLDDADNDPAAAGAIRHRQDLSVYTSFLTGPRRANDCDGPQAMHVILLDNRPLSYAGQRIPRHAPLHPLRRMRFDRSHIRRCRRPCLWLGIFRAGGRGSE